MFYVKLKKIWVMDASDAPDTKTSEECTPGKPFSVFSNTPQEGKLEFPSDSRFSRDTDLINY